jgi:hypothetical protein
VTLRRAPCLLLFALALLGCASTARVTGDFGDYASYRRTRLAVTLEERLGASERYLREHPNGDYSDEVRAWFRPAEKRYFKLAWNTLPRLRAYLDAMPHGPHADAVTDRITQLESRSVFADRREQRILQHARSIEERLASAAEQRHTFLREFRTLTRLLGATRSFGEPTSELDSELLLRFRVQQPAGQCANDYCTKTFSFPYSVPGDDGLVDRIAQVTLEITLDRGLVKKVALSGPELLTRLSEALQVHAVAADNPQARAESLGRAQDFIDEALDEPLPKTRCRSDVISPTILARRCDGVVAEVIAGLDPTEPDRLSATTEKR